MIHDLLDRTEDAAERRYLINYFLDQFKSTMFRQTMFAEFERDTHAAVQCGETLTSEALCSAYYELNRRYFAEAMEADEDIAFEWQAHSAFLHAILRISVCDRIRSSDRDQQQDPLGRAGNRREL